MQTDIHPKCYIVLLSTLSLLSSCVKDDLYGTPHPDSARLTVTADWSARGSGIDIPGQWQIHIGDYEGTETGSTHTLDHLFTPGDYRLTAWNPASDITVVGTEATVSSESSDPERISNTPGWLFTSAQEVTLDHDRDYFFTALMRQQVRQLTLVIEPTGDSSGRIESIEASLSGVAGTLEFSTDTHGTPSEISLPFQKVTAGSDSGKWTVTVRLLGIAGTHPQLTGTIGYAGGNPQPVSLSSDLTESLSGFNESKSTPLTLSGLIVSSPTGANFTATISGWQTVYGAPAEAK